jgi:hypothetical protein
MKCVSTLLAAVAVLACSDSFTPTVDNVAGTYSLQTFRTITDTNGTKDWVAAGATFSLVLAANGTTTGQLFIPGGDEDGGDFSADMTGTWTLTDRTVEFDQGADSFVRDFPFSAGENTLTMDRTIPGLRLTVVLRK